MQVQFLRDLGAQVLAETSDAYALAYRAVVEMASLDTARGLAQFFANWRTERSMDRAVRRTFGITLSGFERLWQQRTRRRYGALALIGDVTLGGLLLRSRRAGCSPARSCPCCRWCCTSKPCWSVSPLPS